MHTTPHYLHTVEVSLLAYAMVSTLGDAGQEWLHLDVAHLYLPKLRKLERPNALPDPNIWPHIAECETHTRNEWHDTNFSDPSISLGDIIALSRDRDRFPGAPKVTPSKMQRNRPPPKKNGDFSQGPTPREAYPKFASDGSCERKREGDKEHSTRGSKGTPYMGKDFCHRNQRNACSHGIACKYARDANEMATIQAWPDANMRVQAPDLSSGKAQKKLDDQRGGNARGDN